MIRKVLFILVGIMAITSINLVLQPISADDGIIIETDSDTYNHSSMIILTGNITVIDQNPIDVTVQIFAPNGNIASVAQVAVNTDGVFSTTFNTAGAMMKYDGTYQIKAVYGFIETTISIELTNAIESAMTSDTMETAETTLEDAIKDGQINWMIDNGIVTSFFVNGDENSLVLYMEATDDGILDISLHEDIIKPFDDGTYFVTVNGMENQDFEQNVNQLSIPFTADTEKITIFGGWAIPEFGTIAIMILVVAIVSIIALSAKTKLSLVPRY
jgi:predicted secreted protein with PEFG-CTERM motif